MSPLLLLVELVLLLFPLSLLLLSFKQALSRKKKLPPSPPKFPFIGNLLQLGSLPHRSLRTLAEKHGPLMLLHLGQVPTVVVSSAEMAQEIMRTHDHIFASRPSLKAANDLFSGSMDVAFAPYGDYWRQARKLCTLHLLSAKKVHSFRLAREEEVAVMLRKISRACLSPDPVNLSEVLFSFANDMICRAVTGNFFREGGRNDLLREVIEENTSLLTGFHVEDFFPSLAWLEVLFGLGARAKRNVERWNHVFEEVIKDHDDRMKDGNKENNFADVLLCLQKDPNMEFALTEENIKNILMLLNGFVGTV
ncbi:cytochrome P450 71AP13-like [Elaeis guineensis]|uniref:cytochrome P450 71AP13-like n=1 Tax=Elaeis guineensis var. tenera TaxID=51953 RepID=UPI003C6DB107